MGRHLEQLDSSFLSTLDAYIQGASNKGAADVAGGTPGAAAGRTFPCMCAHTTGKWGAQLAKEGARMRVAPSWRVLPPCCCSLLQQRRCQLRRVRRKSQLRVHSSVT
ncbi:hypothetical protein ABPG75_008067 [Micractinium tetrahymenae]